MKSLQPSEKGFIEKQAPPHRPWILTWTHVMGCINQIPELTSANHQWGAPTLPAAYVRTFTSQ
jgi:hypothetical protein